MTDAEIKKAWNTFKRKVAKETELGGNAMFYMNVKQIANRTATMSIGYYHDSDWSEDIRREDESLAKVMGFDTWTYEEKARSKMYHDERVACWKEKTERFGTHKNYCDTVIKQICTSKAYAEFCAKFDSNVYEELECDKYNFATIRIHY